MLFFFLLVCLQTAKAVDTEQLGHFEISEFALSPRLRLQEPGLGGFELSQSWIGFEWTRDPRVRGVLKLGSEDLIRPVIWNTNQVRPSFGVSEAWMEGQSEYADLRAGLLAVPQNFEGLSSEWSSVLPESRARSKSWLIKRDFGLQLKWNTGKWQTSLTIHNGESAENKDGQYFTTGHWYYKNNQGWGGLATASVGQMKPVSTSGSTAGTVGGGGFIFDKDKRAKVRQGSLAFFREEARSLFLVEGGRGEILQEEDKNSFFWGHVDLVLNRGGDLSFLARYEQDQSDQKTEDSIEKSYGAGFSVSSANNLQSLTVFYNRIEEKPEVPSDEIWLIFRLHSFAAQK